MSAPFRLEALAKHDRSTFACGSAPLDTYLRKQAKQDIKRRIANCYVAIDVESSAIAAFYTLSAASLVLTELPPEMSKRLPRYPLLPAARIGRLAVDLNYQKRGLGGAMIADAASRVLNSQAAMYAMMVDAKDGAAVAFYEHHGFRTLPSAPMSLFMPIETARKAWLDE